LRPDGTPFETEEDQMNRLILAGLAALVVVFAFPATLEAG